MSSRGIDEKHQRIKKRGVETEADQIVMTGSIFKEGWFKMYEYISYGCSIYPPKISEPFWEHFIQVFY